jgi:NifU-like protein involved in Fe-S cluster formation
MDPYSPLVRAYFAHPEHGGVLAGGIAVTAPAQGVRIELGATCEAGRVQALRFRAWGCPHVIAAAEAFCRDFEGEAVSALTGFESGAIRDKLSVPVEKTGRILVLEDAVRALGQKCAEFAPD